MRQWRKTLAWKGVRIPRIDPTDQALIEAWHDAVEQEGMGIGEREDWVRLSSIMHSLRLMIDEPTPMDEWMAFEQLYLAKKADEWVPMANRWIDIVNAQILQDAVPDKLDQFMPGGELWHLRGFGSNPKVRDFLERWLVGEARSGGASALQLDELRSQLANVTGGDDLMRIWVEAHKVAKVAWPSVSTELIEDAKKRHRLTDLARRIVLLWEAALNERIDPKVMAQLNAKMATTSALGADAEIERILNELISEVNKQVVG